MLWHIQSIDTIAKCSKPPAFIEGALTFPISNEITRKKSDFLEGTYVVHGIEEVMDKNDIVFVIDPKEESTWINQDVRAKWGMNF